jgi:hypothetical protein
MSKNVQSILKLCVFCWIHMGCASAVNPKKEAAVKG